MWGPDNATTSSGPRGQPGKWLIHCHIGHHTTNNNVEAQGGWRTHDGNRCRDAVSPHPDSGFIFYERIKLADSFLFPEPKPLKCKRSKKRRVNETLGDRPSLDI